MPVTGVISSSTFPPTADYNLVYSQELIIKYLKIFSHPAHEVVFPHNEVCIWFSCSPIILKKINEWDFTRKNHEVCSIVR